MCVCVGGGLFSQFIILLQSIYKLIRLLLSGRKRSSRDYHYVYGYALFFPHFYKREQLLCFLVCSMDKSTLKRCLSDKTRARGYKTFFVLNSAEHEILNAHKYESIKKFSIRQAQISLECYFTCS